MVQKFRKKVNRIVVQYSKW